MSLPEPAGFNCNFGEFPVRKEEEGKRGGKGPREREPRPLRQVPAGSSAVVSEPAVNCGLSELKTGRSKF